MEQVTLIPRLPDRLGYLDSLRGIAAVLVVFHHIYQTAPFWPDVVRFSPFRLLLNGRSSVIFFFVLSGFVLAYGLWRGDQQKNYFIFVLRRLARIYIPYLAAGLAAICAMLILAPTELWDTAITFNEMWAFPLTWAAALGHLLLLGSDITNSVNSPSWSLVYEIRVSLLIPFFCLLAFKSAFRFAIVSLALYTFVDIALWRSGLNLVPYNAEGFSANVLVTAHFAAHFIVGVLLAKSAITRARWLYEMPGIQKITLSVVGAISILIFRDETIVLGSAILIILALNTNSLQHVLANPKLLWIGKISFSLYLTHMIVLEVVVRVLHGQVSLWFSLVVALCLMFPVAAAFFQLVEWPAVLLSRSIQRSQKN